jgi:uncharacterized phage protein (TIGR02218 family)
MRTLPTGLAAHVASGVTTLCHCWKLKPAGRAAMGFTDHDLDLSFDGVTYEAQAGFDASEIESSLGLSVDNLEASGALRSDRLDAELLRTGYFDKAEIEIYRVNWRDVSERLLVRKGHLGEVSHGGVGFTAEVRGLSHLLNQTKGRVFQFGCDASVGDGRCGVNLETSALKVSGVVTSVDDAARFGVSGLGGYGEGWFSLGTLTWVSGANAGRVEEVKSHQGSVIELWHRAGFDVAIGDGFTLRAGCDKQFATCRGKFFNGNNFRGFPDLPGTDFVSSFATGG